MRPEDKTRFFELLDLTYDIIGVNEGKFISGPAKAMFFDDLRQYPIEYIEKALTAHRQDPQRGKFTPKPADIIFQIERRMPVQWVGADEAWSRIPKPGKPVQIGTHRHGAPRYDYRAAEPPPCLMNQVTAQAMIAAMPMLDEGDHVAARMAFKDAYNRLVEVEKLARRPPKYFVSPGGTYDEQLAVAAEGVRLGLLPPSAAPQESSHALLPSAAGQKAISAALATLQLKHVPQEDDHGTDEA